MVVGLGVASGERILKMALTPPEFYLVDNRDPLALPNPPNGNAAVMLEDDVTRSDPEEALLEVGVGIVHVLREDLALIGNPYFSETTVKF